MKTSVSGSSDHKPHSASPSGIAAAAAAASAAAAAAAAVNVPSGVYPRNDSASPAASSLLPTHPWSGRPTPSAAAVSPATGHSGYPEYARHPPYMGHAAAYHPAAYPPHSGYYTGVTNSMADYMASANSYQSAHQFAAAVAVGHQTGGPPAAADFYAEWSKPVRNPPYA